MNRRIILSGLVLALACKGDLKTGPTPGPAVMSLLQGNAQTAEVGTALPVAPAVLITNDDGLPAEGVVVVFAVAEGGGTAGVTSVATGPDGIASAGSWTLGVTSGTNRLTASSDGITGSPLTFSATARPGVPAQAELLTPPPATVGSGALFSPQPSVQLQDTYGNPDEVAGTLVTVSIFQGSGATLVGTPTAVTDATGTATFTDLRLQGVVGDYTLSFSSPPLPPVTAATHISPGSATTVSKQAGDNQTAPVGTAVGIAPAVLVRDASGNPVAGVPVAFTVALGGGSIAGGTATTNQLGIASSGNWTLGPTAGPNTLTATVTGLAPVTFTATGTVVPPGPPASITKIAGDNQTGIAGTAAAESLVVQVRDGNGLALSGVSVSWTVLGGGGLVSPVASLTDAAGLARSRWTLGSTAGANTVRASAAGFNALFAGTGVAGAPSTLARHAGNNQTAPVSSPVPINPSVIVTDAGGNPVAGVAVAFAVTGGGGSVATAQALTDGLGIASGGAWTLGPIAGGNSLTATAAGLSGSPVTFSATGTVLPPGPPAAIIKVSGDAQTAVAGAIAPESLVVQVRDANGAGVSGIAVSWTVLTGGGSVSPVSLNTGAGGLAAVEWTFGTSVGSNSVRATAAGFNATFAGAGIAGSATTMSKQAGDNQTAVAGTALPIQPSVVVEDAAGNPVAGVTVSFAVASGGGTIANGQALTNGQGIASSGTWTLGPAAGANTLTATAAGLSGSPATFSATGTALPPGPPAAILKVSGDGQTAVAGQAAAESLVVQVRDANGTAVPGATVTWLVLTGGGSVSSASVITDAGGFVGVEWTLGSTAGANTVQAGVAGFNVTFTGTGVAGAATTLAKQAGDNQTGTVGSPLPINSTVIVTDAGGNPVSGVLVSFSVTGGGGSIAVAQDLTNAQGIASGGSWTLGPAVGSNTLTATAFGLSGSPATFLATGTVLPPGPPTGIIKVSGDAQTAVAGAIAPESLVVQVRDANGAGVPGITVTWTVLTGGGSVSPVSVSTGAGGLAAVEWTLGAVAGSNTARATAAGFSRTFTGTGIAGAATTLAKQAGDNQTAVAGTAVPIQPSVVVEDAGGNPVAGVTVNFAVAAGGGSIENGQALTNGQGIASGGIWTLGPAVGPNTLTATAPGLSGSPATFTATGTPIPPGPPASITRVSGDAQSAVAGGVAPESLVVQVRDANGTLVPGATVTWAVSSGGGSVSPGSVVTGSSGLAAVEWTLGNVAGPNTAQATVAGFNTIFTATGIPGAAALLVKQAGDNQSAPVSSPAPVDPVVKVTDAVGNPVAGVSVSFAVAGGGGGISTAQAQTDAQGLASGGTWTLGPAAGPNSLTAVAAGLSGSPATFSATGTVLPPGPPASITRISGNAQSVVAGEIAPESLVVQVRDANGVGLNGITVTWTILSGGGSVAPVSLNTGAGGLAAVEWTIGTITGTNSVRATAAGFNTTFTADGIAGAPATLTRVSGNNQTAPAGSPVALDPTVAVHDANGNAVAGVSVGFAVTAGGGSIQNSSGLTDAQGRTNGGTWTLGALAGANELTATVSGLAGSPLPFAATGTPTTGPPASLAIISGDHQTATVATVLPESLVVRVADAGGTGIPGVAVSWTILGGGGTVSSSAVNTDLGGLAAVRWTLGTLAGINSVEASAAGFTQAFTATGVAGPPARLAIVTQPGPGQSGVVLGVQPLLQLLDGNGNPAPQAGIPVAAAIASGGGTLGGTISMVTDGAGRAQFTDLTISGLVGSRTLAFNSAGLTGVTSTSLSIAAGPAATLSKQVGDNQSALAGTPVAVNPRVVVTDASGNPVSGVTVDFAVTFGGGSIAAGSSVTTPLGRATGGQWILGPAAGSNTLTATAAGLAGSPAVFTATGTSTTGAPASIAKVDGDNQTAIVGTVPTDSLVVQVLDANGNGVPGIAVSWVVLSGGGSLSSAAGTTDATGLASVAWTLGVIAGPNTARATAAGFNVTFSATGVAGAAVSLSKQSGDNQTAEVNVAVPVDPTVLVVDAHGNPVAGVAVSFTVIAGNGMIALPSAATDALGMATGGNWILGPVAGANSLRASSPGLAGSPALFTATGTSAAHTPVPLIDLGAGTYFGFPGGLYPTGNTPPTAHAAAGAARARNVRPRSFNGNPNANGKFVLLSIGLSNTTMEWCTAVVTQPCNSWSLMGQAAADATVNHQEMVIANGARPGQEADTWESPADVNYDLVRDNVLLPQGLSEQQVEIVWLKVVNGNPQTSLPSTQADAIELVTQYGNILRALKVRYPNLQMVFFSSRIYAGYATSLLNPEPYAYETGFAVKWVIEAQIDQMANGGSIVDPRAGNLNFNTVAPWIGWGPYLWADGLNPRSDGLTWVISDYELDHTHPARSGQTKVAGMLLNFFKTDPRASCWFRAGLTCP